MPSRSRLPAASERELRNERITCKEARRGIPTLGRAPLRSRRRRAHPRCSGRGGELGLVEHGSAGGRVRECVREFHGLPARLGRGERHRRTSSRPGRERVRSRRRGDSALAQLRRGREHDRAYRRGARLLRRAERDRPQPRSSRRGEQPLRRRRKRSLSSTMADTLARCTRCSS